ncbi:DUF6383 domain-containing protein [uncultured Parabacteroides sp.]|uniref:DUF6383 domain-containing protein n=1 Tax=uncultured Parabacteroides sp. TaxID=512312 RepID=UPI0025E8F1FE|nr:DUF6383 domain-containing protein [uncultured Parabacteroides sp.]
MKFFIFLILNLFCLNILASGSFPYEISLFTPSPKNPFTGYFGNIKKMTADKVIWKYYSGETFNKAATTYYKYSEDGLTIKVNDKDTYIFYPNGKLKKQTTDYADETFTYTDDGKLLSIKSSYREIFCHYTNSGIDSMMRWSYSDRLQKFILTSKYIVTYNSNGYKWAQYDYDIEEDTFVKYCEYLYEFNKQNQLTKIFELKDHENSNIIEERFYFENRTEIYTYQRGEYDRKYKFIFNDKHDLIEESCFIWGGYWGPYYTSLYTYFYNGSVSNEKIPSKSNYQIHTSTNNIIITNINNGERIYIFDISGRLHYSAVANSDQCEINLPSNQIYIVQVGNKKIKLRL